MGPCQDLRKYTDGLIFLLRTLFSTMCFCVYLCVGMCTRVHTQEFLCFIFFMKEKNTQKRSEEGVIYPGAGVIDFCESLNMDPGS